MGCAVGRSKSERRLVVYRMQTTPRHRVTRRRVEGTVSGGDEQGPEDEDGADRGGEQGPEGEPRELYNGTGVRRGEVLPTLTGDDSGGPR